MQGVNVSGYGTAAAAVEGKCGRWTNYTVLVAGGAVGSCPYAAAKAGGGKGVGHFLYFSPQLTYNGVKIAP